MSTIPSVRDVARRVLRSEAPASVSLAMEQIMSLGATPRKDQLLLAWSLNFKTLISLSPIIYGLTASQATQYGAAHDLFASTLQTATEPSTRTKAAVAAKDSAKVTLRALAGSFGGMVEKNIAVTDAQKIDLGLTVRAQPSPIPAPSSAPVIAIVSTTGRTVKIKLKDIDTARRGKPLGVHGCAVFSYVGATAPTTTMGWHFEGNTNQTTFDVEFPETVPAGAQVWFTAMWFNPRSQSGPPATFISTNLPGGGAMPLAA